MSLSHLSTHNLREAFKQQIGELILLLDQNKNTANLYLEIQKVSESLEKLIQEKTKLLETDFQNQILFGDYLHSVSEGFDDLDRLLRSSQTFVDVAQGKTKEELLQHIKKYHHQTLVPLLNIFSKLENDYLSLLNLYKLRRTAPLPLPRRNW